MAAGYAGRYYRINNELAESEGARQSAIALAQEVGKQGMPSVFNMRAMDLAYKLQERIPIYRPSE